MILKLAHTRARTRAHTHTRTHTHAHTHAYTHTHTHTHTNTLVTKEWAEAPTLTQLGGFDLTQEARGDVLEEPGVCFATAMGGISQYLFEGQSTILTSDCIFTLCTNWSWNQQQSTWACSFCFFFLCPEFSSMKIASVYSLMRRPSKQPFSA